MRMRVSQELSASTLSVSETAGTLNRRSDGLTPKRFTSVSKVEQLSRASKRDEAPQSYACGGVSLRRVGDFSDR